MRVTRSKEGVKITLPKYKINVRKLSGTKNSYQYTCILPPLLCSFFGVGTVESVDPDEDIYYKLLMFYEVDEEKIIISGSEFKKASEGYHKHNKLEFIRNIHDPKPDPELIKYCEENPINFRLFDRINYMEQYNTSVYKLKNSNTYRLTLPSNLFKDYIQHDKPNYIEFTIDTTKEDLQLNRGIVTYEVIN